MGKTTLIQNMIVADMRAGRGICLIDPHGDHYCALMLRSENSRCRMSGVVNWELLAKSEVTPESRDWTPERAEQAIREAAKRLPELCDRLELVTRAEPIHRVASPETTGTKANVMFPACHVWTKNSPHADAMNDFGRDASGAQARVDGTAVSVESAEQSLEPIRRDIAAIKRKLKAEKLLTKTELKRKQRLDFCCTRYCSKDPKPP